MKIKQIKEFVDTYFHTDISIERRERTDHDKRYMFFYLCLKYGYDKTYRSIGNSVNRDHTTVLHGLHEFRNLMKIDQTFNDVFTNLENTFLKMYDLKNTPQEYIINPNTENYLRQISILNKKLEKVRNTSKARYNTIMCYKRTIKNLRKKLANK